MATMGDDTPRSAYEVHRRNSPKGKIAPAVSPQSRRRSVRKEIPQEVTPAMNERPQRKSIKKGVVQEMSPTKSLPKFRRSNVSASQEMASTSDGSDSEELSSTKNESVSQEMPSTGKRKMDSDDNVNGITEQRTVAKKKRGRKTEIKDTITNDIETVNSAIQQGFTVTEKRNVKKASTINGNMNVIPKTSAEFNIAQLDGLPCGNEFAERSFNWLISPIKPETFFKNFWEKKPLHIPRSNHDVFTKLFSSADIDKIIKENDLTCGVDIDVLKYVDGQRKPVENDIRVTSRFLWNSYLAGNSIRLRNPQVFHKPLWNVCSHLQEYLSSYIGVNMYLTPPDEQGFPPHYDDIDAFVLQIEGKKHWKFYEARDSSEILPSHSSGDLDEESLGNPILEVDLLPGDVLYFPRGWIHEAKSAEDSHSLHLTLSANQLNTWGDLLKEGLEEALKTAMEHDVEFRKTLPKDYLDFAGSANCNSESKMRQAFKQKVTSLAESVMKYFSVDAVTDVHAIDFIHGSLPPVFTELEKDCSVYGNLPSMKDGKVLNTEDLTLDTEVRLLRKRSFRLTVDEKGPRLYYSLTNTRNHKEIEEALYLDIDSDLVPAVNLLFKIHPAYVKILDLPVEDPETRLSLATQLYDAGLLMTKEPLPHLSEDDS